MFKQITIIAIVNNKLMTAQNNIYIYKMHTRVCVHLWHARIHPIHPHPEKRRMACPHTCTPPLMCMHACIHVCIHIHMHSCNWRLFCDLIYLQSYMYLYIYIIHMQQQQQHNPVNTHPCTCLYTQSDTACKTCHRRSVQLSASGIDQNMC